MPVRGQPLSEAHRLALAAALTNSRNVESLVTIARAMDISPSSAGILLATALAKAKVVLEERGYTQADLLNL